MQRHQTRKATRRFGLAFTAVIALSGSTFAQEAMKDRPGFGYAIDFMTGAAATPLLPVPKEELAITRPGFGYTMQFLPGSGTGVATLAAVWTQELTITRPGFGYAIEFTGGSGTGAAALPAAPTQEVVISRPGSATP